MLAMMTHQQKQKWKTTRTNAETFFSFCLKATEHKNVEDDNDTLPYKNRNKKTSNKCSNLESNKKLPKLTLVMFHHTPE